MRMRPLLAATLAALVTAPAAADEQLVDGIAAQVGSEIVLVSEVMNVVGGMEEQARAQGATDVDIARIRATGLERVIEWRLIEQVVKESELYATDAEIDAAIQSIADQNQLSMEDLVNSVAAHGLPYDDYRAEIKREIERRKVVNGMVGSRVEVAEDDVRRLYDERYSDQPTGGATIHVLQVVKIFDPDQKGADHAEVCGQVQAARDRIAAGEQWQRVASEVTDASPERGGDLGWIHLDTAAPWMRDVVAKLEPGQTSPVLELHFGCVLIQLADRREYEPVSFEAAEPKLQQEIYDQKLDEAFSDWIETVRERTYIDRKGYFADAASFSKGSSADASGQPPRP